MEEEDFKKIILAEVKRISELNTLEEVILEYEKVIQQITSLSETYIVLVNKEEQYLNVLSRGHRITIGKEMSEGLLLDCYDRKKQKIVRNARRHIFYRHKIDNFIDKKLKDILMIAITDDSDEKNVIAIIWVATMQDEKKILGKSDMNYLTRFSSMVKMTLLHQKEILRPTMKYSLVEKRKEQTLLLVDDDKLILAYLNVVFRGYFKNIIYVNSGIEAIERFKHKKIDMIFMDEIMAGMAGHTAIAKIREIEIKRKLIAIPIFALTSDTDKETREILLEHGANKVLYKPIDMKCLMDAIF